MAFEDNGFSKKLTELSNDLAQKEIKSIIIISAHYESDKFAITCQKNLKTIHDHGFSELFSFDYKNARGDEELGMLIYKAF